jgi:hypothetical protein
MEPTNTKCHICTSGSWREKLPIAICSDDGLEIDDVIGDLEAMELQDGDESDESDSDVKDDNVDAIID